MKKITILGLCSIMLLAVFTACNSQSSGENVETEKIRETEEVISVFKKAYDYALEKEKENYINSLDEYNTKAESDKVRTIEEWEELWKKNVCKLGDDESYILVRPTNTSYADVEDTVRIVNYLNESLGLSDSIYGRIFTFDDGEVTENGINVTWKAQVVTPVYYSILYTKSES